MRRAVVALLKAASVKQLAVLALVVLGGVLVLIDVLAGDPPSSKPEPVPPAPPVQPVPPEEAHSLLEVVFSGPEFVRFVGFCMLSVGILAGMAFLLWRHIRRSD